MRGAAKQPTGAPARALTRRKNIRLDQRKLDEARRALGAATETATIEQALDLVVFRDRAAAGMQRLLGKGGFRNVFDADADEER